MLSRITGTVSLRQSCSLQTNRTNTLRQIASATASSGAQVKPEYSHIRLVPRFHANAKPSQLSATTPNGTEPIKPFYSITRTPTRGLPVYEIAKAGGNLKLTRVRKLAGNRENLKKELEAYLMPKPAYVKINPVTGHVIVKVGLAGNCSRSPGPTANDLRRDGTSVKLISFLLRRASRPSF